MRRRPHVVSTHRLLISSIFCSSTSHRHQIFVQRILVFSDLPLLLFCPYWFRQWRPLPNQYQSVQKSRGRNSMSTTRGVHSTTCHLIQFRLISMSSTSYFIFQIINFLLIDYSPPQHHIVIAIFCSSHLNLFSFYVVHVRFCPPGASKFSTNLITIQPLFENGRF